MSGQHPTTLSSLSSTVFACLVATLFFVASVWGPLRLWRPLTCSLNEQGTCDFDPIVALLGVAVACLVHSISVATFAWTPLSAPLRSTFDDLKHPSMFNAFLYASIASDVVAYGYALTFVEGFIGFLQAITITFNAPFIVFAPYVLAAYRDPTTDIGSFVHRIRERIAEYYRNEQQDCSSSHADPECVHARLERALLLLPHSRESLECPACLQRFTDEDGEVDMATIRTFPKFTLFVTAPTDAPPEHYMPLPVSQRA